MGAADGRRRGCDDEIERDSCIYAALTPNRKRYENARGRRRRSRGVSCGIERLQPCQRQRLDCDAPFILTDAGKEQIETFAEFLTRQRKSAQPLQTKFTERRRIFRLSVNRF